MIAADQIQFDPASHRYWLAGEETPSTTQALEAEGLHGNDWWTDAARKRGTAVHQIALLVSHGAKGRTVEEVVERSQWDPFGTAPFLVPYGMACVQYYVDTGIEPMLVEERVASLRFRLCGTLDMYGRMPNGKMRLTDYKSGEPQPSAEIQTNLYAMQLEEAYGLKTDEIAIVWLMRDGRYRARISTPGGEALAIGQMAVNLYHWRRKHRMVA